MIDINILNANGLIQLPSEVAPDILHPPEIVLLLDHFKDSPVNKNRMRTLTHRYHVIYRLVIERCPANCARRYSRHIFFKE